MELIKEFFNLILTVPLYNLTMFLYFLTGNLGLSIILLTVLIKAILVPATNPQLRTMKKQQALKPELDKIKKSIRTIRKNKPKPK